MVGTQDWVVNLTPDPPIYKRLVSDNFNQVLGAAFQTHPGWSAEYSLEELADDSLIVTTYDAQQDTIDPGDKICSTCVGAEFQVK
jgi:hypothetical protein